MNCAVTVPSFQLFGIGNMNWANSAVDASKSKLAAMTLLVVLSPSA
jgi:hypothetical protein